MHRSYFDQFFISAMIALLWCCPAAAQDRSIVWPKEPGSRIKPAGTPGGQSNALAQFDSFEIQDITVERKSIIIGQPFSASDDWLNAISVRIKNISQQRFRTIQVTLSLTEIKGGPIIPVCFGCSLAEYNKGIGPGEEAELRTIQSDEFYNWVKTRISEQATLSSITTAQIQSTWAVLWDGTELLSECVKTANPRNACPRVVVP